MSIESPQPESPEQVAKAAAAEKARVFKIREALQAQVMTQLGFDVSDSNPDRFNNIHRWADTDMHHKFRVAFDWVSDGKFDPAIHGPTDLVQLFEEHPEDAVGEITGALETLQPAFDQAVADNPKFFEEYKKNNDLGKQLLSEAFEHMHQHN